MGAIDKLERFGGCIMPPSVGLGNLQNIGRNLGAEARLLLALPRGAADENSEPLSRRPALRGARLASLNRRGVRS